MDYHQFADYAIIYLLHNTKSHLEKIFTFMENIAVSEKCFEKKKKIERDLSYLEQKLLF